MFEGERLEIQPMGRGVTQDCIFFFGRLWIEYYFLGDGVVRTLNGSRGRP